MTTDTRALRGQVAELERKLDALRTRPSLPELDEMAAARDRADLVATLFGERASAPVDGESMLDYRKRLLRPLVQHSPRLKDARIDSIGDAAVLGHVETIVYDDAKRAAISAAHDSGRLVAIQERDDGDRKITRYYGDIGEFMRPFMQGGQICKINESAK